MTTIFLSASEIPLVSLAGGSRYNVAPGDVQKMRKVAMDISRDGYLGRNVSLQWSHSHWNESHGKGEHFLVLQKISAYELFLKPIKVLENKEYVPYSFVISQGKLIPCEIAEEGVFDESVLREYQEKIYPLLVEFATKVGESTLGLTVNLKWKKGGLDKPSSSSVEGVANEDGASIKPASGGSSSKAKPSEGDGFVSWPLFDKDLYLPRWLAWVFPPTQSP
jgi:hypothetical protein